MKANELMIGDWVFCTYPSINKAVRVAEIKTVGGDNKLKIVIYDDDVRLVFNETYIDSIPLTADILEKNEFECKGGLWNLSGDDMGLMQGSFSFQAFAYYADPRYCFCEIAYVHDLQHALLLCGIEKEIEL